MAKSKPTFDHKAATTAVSWFAQAYKLNDWTFTVSISESPPEWVGEVSPGEVGSAQWNSVYKTADIWVSPIRCAQYDFCPIATLFHETAHILYADAQWDQAAEPGTPAHCCVDRTGIIAARAYKAGAKPQ